MVVSIGVTMTTAVIKEPRHSLLGRKGVFQCGCRLTETLQSSSLSHKRHFQLGESLNDLLDKFQYGKKTHSTFPYAWREPTDKMRRFSLLQGEAGTGVKREYESSQSEGTK